MIDHDGRKLQALIFRRRIELGLVRPWWVSLFRLVFDVALALAGVFA